MPTVETDWAAVQDAFIAWVQDSTGRNANWRDDRQFVMDPNPHFLLHLQAIREMGRVALQYDYNPGDDSLIPKVHNLLDITLEVSCRANNQVKGFLSTQELTKLKLRGKMPARLEALRQARLGLFTSTPITSVNFTHQGRELSQATCSFNFHLLDVYQTSDTSEDYIKETIGTADSFSDGVVNVGITEDGE